MQPDHIVTLEDVPKLEHWIKNISNNPNQSIKPMTTDILLNNGVEKNNLKEVLTYALACVCINSWGKVDQNIYLNYSVITSRKRKTSNIKAALLHELGHVLTLPTIFKSKSYPSPLFYLSNEQIQGIQEFEAHKFALKTTCKLGMEKERKELLNWKKSFLYSSNSFKSLPFKIAGALMSQLSID